MGGVICAFAWLFKLHYQPVHTLYRLFYFMPLYTNSTVLWWLQFPAYSYIRPFHFPENRITIQKVNRTAYTDSPPIDQVGVEERIARLTKRSIKKESKVTALKLALSMVDLTTLDAKDTLGKVKQLCTKAMHPHDALPGVPPVAAVCVYPEFCADCQKMLSLVQM